MRLLNRHCSSSSSPDKRFRSLTPGETISYDYSLDIDSNLNSHQAMHLFAERLNATLSDEHFAYTRDILISGHDSERNLWTEVIEESFHFTPTLTMGFREDRDGSYKAFYALMLRAVMLLLEHGGDAVMLANGEHIVLQRLGWTLVINSEKTAQVEAIIKQEVHIPYESRPLPSPLL